MKRILFFLFLLATVPAGAQDSSVPADTGSLPTKAPSDTLLAQRADSYSLDSARALVLERSFLDIRTPGWFFLQREREDSGMEFVFYYIVFLLLVYGVIRKAYPRYSSDIFRYYFQSTLRIQQIKEQLSLSVIPALFYHLLFLLSAGAFLFLLADYFRLSFMIPRLYLPVAAFLVLLLIYLFKNLFVRFIGWAFQQRKAAGIYLFIILLTNKILGILLLPLVVGIAFSSGVVKDIFISVSVTLVIALFVFRFFRAYQPLAAEFRLGFLPYGVYLLAAEITPLLLIYKLLMTFL